MIANLIKEPSENYFLLKGKLKILYTEALLTKEYKEFKFNSFTKIFTYIIIPYNNASASHYINMSSSGNSFFAKLNTQAETNHMTKFLVIGF